MNEEKQTLRYRRRPSLFGGLKSLLLVCFLVASLTLNVATVAVSSVATLVSGLYEAITGFAAVGSELRSAHRAQTSELDARKRRIAALEVDVAKKRKAIDVTGDALKRAALDVELRDRQLELLATDVTQRTKALRSADGELRRAVLDIELRDQQLKSLSGEVVTLRRGPKVMFKGRRTLVSEAVEETAGIVSRRTAAGASRNVGSMAAEAVPFWGIAVMVSVTAWDIKDACATMTDLHALDRAFNPERVIGNEANEVCGTVVPTAEELWEMALASPGKAWDMARSVLPDLPEFTATDIDWSPWN